MKTELVNILLLVTFVFLFSSIVNYYYDDFASAMDGNVDLLVESGSADSIKMIDQKNRESMELSLSEEQAETDSNVQAQLYSEIKANFIKSAFTITSRIFTKLYFHFET
ncbi:hypothetical protein [Alteribacter aurantiacus]|uniref:hypothetical protein n=1 Tax=Alteribacter aurantiacus TaxID=254410 RepID=UPI00047C5C55|nr:hypothetical protein [Alteribacter aurantiacus]